MNKFAYFNAFEMNSINQIRGNKYAFQTFFSYIY